MATLSVFFALYLDTEKCIICMSWLLPFCVLPRVARQLDITRHRGRI